MKRIPIWQTFTAIIIMALGLIAIWWGVTPPTTLSTPTLPAETATVPPTSVTISKAEFSAALNFAAGAYSDIVAIEPNFVTDAIEMNVAISGAAGNVSVNVTLEDGDIGFDITSMTLNGAPAPANYAEIVSRDLPLILTATLDNLMIARFGSVVDVQSITIDDEAMVVSDE